ncbi:MAG: hypothetical protein NTX42_06845 [Methanothrix sp.]|nr:hypothetical protein [Methanothrix sp.]
MCHACTRPYGWRGAGWKREKNNRGFASSHGALDLTRSHEEAMIANLMTNAKPY